MARTIWKIFWPTQSLFSDAIYLLTSFPAIAIYHWFSDHGFPTVNIKIWYMQSNNKKKKFRSEGKGPLRIYLPDNYCCEERSGRLFRNNQLDTNGGQTAESVNRRNGLQIRPCSTLFPPENRNFRRCPLASSSLPSASCRRSPEPGAFSGEILSLPVPA